MLRRNSPYQQRFIAGFGVIFCLGMLFLSVPRLVASLYALYPEAIFKQEHSSLSKEVYEEAIADLTKALAWYNNPEYLQMRGVFYLALFNTFPPGVSEQNLQLIRQARQDTMQGLKLSPVDPAAWFRLAMMDYVLKEPDQKVIEALIMSFYAGRVDYELLFPRLFFSYLYLDRFNDEMRQIWQKQLPLAWSAQPTTLMAFVAQHRDVRLLVEEALINSPDDLKNFTDAFENYIKQNFPIPAK